MMEDNATKKKLHITSDDKIKNIKIKDIWTSDGLLFFKILILNAKRFKIHQAFLRNRGRKMTGRQRHKENANLR